MNCYKALSNQVFELGEYRIVPIRMQDRRPIMKWRNEQLYHLRQSKPLTEADQDSYFEEVISNLFDQNQPNQILFSYLQGDTCIGYGGVVHINWVDSNGEISFIMDTSLEKDYFSFHWTNFLKLIEEVGFDELSLHKLFVYAFDLRPQLYDVLFKNGFFRDAELKEHCYFENKFIDVIIYSKLYSTR